MEYEKLFKILLMHLKKTKKTENSAEAFKSAHKIQKFNKEHKNSMFFKGMEML